MNEMELKYGCNPNQKPARVFMNDNKNLPFQVDQATSTCWMHLTAGSW